jgi:hypothetical protein
MRQPDAAEPPNRGLLGLPGEQRVGAGYLQTAATGQLLAKEDRHHGPGAEAGGPVLGHAPRGTELERINPDEHNLGIPFPCAFLSPPHLLAKAGKADSGERKTR